MKICDICKKEAKVYETNDFMKDLGVNDVCKPCADIIDKKIRDFTEKQIDEKIKYRKQVVEELLTNK